MSSKSSTEAVSAELYEELFRETREKALYHALEIRKFEIELYWKRATYFWTFISVVMGGFLAARASNVSNKQDILIILSCLGLVFSVAWFNANRGSKFWQENWEKHVDMLEDDVIGPLYKVRVSRNDSKKLTDAVKDFLTGPQKLSVSKINQLISFYMIALWLVLLFISLPEFDFDAGFNMFYLVLVAISLVACVTFFTLARSYSGGAYNKTELRKSRIKPSIELKADK